MSPVTASPNFQPHSRRHPQYLEALPLMVCPGQFRLPGCRADLGLDDSTLDRGRQLGAATLVIGVANRGGVVPAHWIDHFFQALDYGYDIANGLHQQLSDIPEIAHAANSKGRLLFDVRHPSCTFQVGTGKKRSGRRVLTVGTDCSVGKMYTALALEKEMHRRGIKADFCATGQTGILIAGSGISIDAVVADFVSGAVEHISPANEDDHWDIIEGQGSLFPRFLCRRKSRSSPRCPTRCACLMS